MAAREVYLRYAPGSTAFRYLVRGDRVRLLVRTADAAWIGVEVAHGALGGQRRARLGARQRHQPVAPASQRPIESAVNAGWRGAFIRPRQRAGDLDVAAEIAH